MDEVPTIGKSDRAALPNMCGLSDPLVPVSINQMEGLEGSAQSNLASSEIIDARFYSQFGNLNSIADDC